MYIYPVIYLFPQYIVNQIRSLFYLCLLNKINGNHGIWLKNEEFLL